QRYVVDAELPEGGCRGGNLGRSTVDHDEVGRVGELLGPAGLRVNALAYLRIRVVGVLGSDAELADLLAFLEVAAEPAPDHLVHRCDVVLAVESLDAEPAVLALAGQPVLEHHHGGNDLGRSEEHTSE